MVLNLVGLEVGEGIRFKVWSEERVPLTTLTVG